MQLLKNGTSGNLRSSVYATIFLFFTGCCAPPMVRNIAPTGEILKVTNFYPDTGKGYSGTGFVIAKDLIVTAYHVVDGDDFEPPIDTWVNNFKKKHRAAVVVKDLYLFPDNIEHVAVLQAKTRRWCPDDFFKLGVGKPYKIITRDGEFLWADYTPTKGHSGSPVLNFNNEVVGTLWGGGNKKGTGTMLRISPNILR